MREEDCIDKATFLKRKKLREEQVQTLKGEIEDLKLIIREQSDIWLYPCIILSRVVKYVILV